jgi:hypothetical protein
MHGRSFIRLVGCEPKAVAVDTADVGFHFRSAPHYVFFIVWFSVFCPLCVLWCNINQRIIGARHDPVLVSVVPGKVSEHVRGSSLASTLS